MQRDIEETKKCKKLLVWPHVLKWFHANSTRLVNPDEKRKEPQPEPAEDVQIKVLELLGLEWLEEAPEGVKRAMDDKLLNNGKKRKRIKWKKSYDGELEPKPKISKKEIDEEEDEGEASE